MAKSTLDAEGFAEGFLLLAIGYVLVNYFRSRSATDQGGPMFPASEPAQSGFGGAIDILAPMQISASGLAFIKQEEGLTLTKRREPNGAAVIGYGHDIKPGENIPNTITKAFAEQLFQGDQADAAAAVNNAITVQVSQDQFDAMADLAFNIGASAFARSSLVKSLNAGDFQTASDDFLQWAKNKNLLGRRSREQQLFNGGGLYA